MRHFGAHLAITALAGLLAAGCTIQPLYAPPGGTSLSAPAPLASIAIAEVDTRVGQQVRNHLIFLLAGGAGEPASAVYELKLTVRSSSKSALLVQTKTDNEPTAEKVTVTVDDGETPLVESTLRVKPVAPHPGPANRRPVVSRITPVPAQVGRESVVPVLAVDADGDELVITADEPSLDGPAEPSPPSEADRLMEALRALHPDDLSPREALEALYALKARLPKE